MNSKASGLILAVAGVFTLASPVLAQDRDNNPPGPRGGPGTNWENPPGPRGGPGASPNRRRVFVHGRPAYFMPRPGGYYYHAR